MTDSYLITYGLDSEPSPPVINVLEAIFNNTINSDKIIENAFKLYIYYYNSYRDNRYSKVILNHSRFTQEMYINLTKYLIKIDLGQFFDLTAIFIASLFALVILSNSSSVKSNLR